MGYIIVFACVLIYGIWYAMNPMRSLKRKYMNEEIPPISIKTARIIGVILAVIGAGGIIYSLIRMAAAG